jgi:hypothetical protein
MTPRARPFKTEDVTESFTAIQDAYDKNTARVYPYSIREVNSRLEYLRYA